MYIEGKTLTSASAIVQWKCIGMFDTERTVRSYQTDAMFDFGSTTISEAIMSIDGYLHGGHVNNITEFNIHVTPDSPTYDDFERCRGWQFNNNETLRYDFSVTIPALKKHFSFSGYMTGHPNLQLAKLINSGTFTFATDMKGSSDTD